MDIQIGNVELLLPVLARVLSALMVMPVFSHRSVPAMVKIVLGISLSWLLVAPGGIENHIPASMSLYLLGLLGEVLIGLLLGFISSLFFWALNMAGELAGRQIGWGFGETLHSSFESSPVATGQLFSILGILIFLSIGGHHLMLKALANTFEIAPPFALAVGRAEVGQALKLVSAMFSGALQMALPVVGTLMLSEAVLAFLARVFPALNAWVFGMPLKVAVGLIALWLGLPAIFILIRQWLMRAPYDMLSLVK
jgi:flagellar biosynthesis protein FliR